MLARVGGAEASIVEVESVNSDQDSAIAVIDSRMDAAETDIDGVQSTASNLSTRMAAVDGGSASSTSIAQLVARNTADQKNSQNMLRDSTFRATDRWTLVNGAVGQQTYLDHTYVALAFGAHRTAYQDVRVQPGVRYALSGDVYSDTDNEVRLYVFWLNEAKSAGMGANSGYDGLFGNAGGASHPGWRHVTFDINNANVNGGYGLIPPTDAVWARIHVDNWPGDGTAGLSAARRLKFESGDYATAWSEDDGYIEARDARAEVVTAEEAIADEVSARAAFQTTAEADIGALEVSVTAQGSAIADIEGNLSASYALTLDVNGRVTGVRFLNDGTTGSIKFLADYFSVYNGSSDVPMFEVSGGAAYIAGSRVRTESMAANAVTVADDDETDADQNVGSSWVAVASCDLTTIDAASRALIMFGAYIESSTDGSLMDARIKRGSTVIWGPKPIAGDPPSLDFETTETGAVSYTPPFNGMVSFFDTDVPGAAGSYTYTVELRVAGSVTTPWVASYRRMFGMIFKR